MQEKSLPEVEDYFRSIQHMHLVQSLPVENRYYQSDPSVAIEDITVQLSMAAYLASPATQADFVLRNDQFDFRLAQVFSLFERVGYIGGNGEFSRFYANTLTPKSDLRLWFQKGIDEKKVNPLLAELYAVARRDTDIDASKNTFFCFDDAPAGIVTSAGDPLLDYFASISTPFGFCFPVMTDFTLLTENPVVQRYAARLPMLFFTAPAPGGLLCSLLTLSNKGL